MSGRGRRMCRLRCEQLIPALTIIRHECWVHRAAGIAGLTLKHHQLHAQYFLLSLVQLSVLTFTILYFG